MRIKDIEIEDYKSIKDQHLSPSSLTVLLGKNNSGKSNVFDALLDYQNKFEEGVSEPWHKKRVTEKKEENEFTINFHFVLSEDEYQEVLQNVEESYRRKWSDEGWLRELRVYRNFHPNSSHKHNILANLKGEWISVDDLISSGKVKKYVRSTLDEIVSNSVESWKFVEPFRNPRDHDSPTYIDEIDDNGANLIRALQSLERSPNRNIYDEICNAYTEIMEGVTELRIEHDFEHSQSDKITLVVKEGGMESRFKSDEISSGSKEILVLLTQIFSAQQNTDLLVLEEPELHLHPGAEKKIFDIISEITDNGGPQIIISTHSEVFVDHSQVDNLVSVRKDPYTILETVENNNWEGKEILGYNNSDLVQSEAVVFVEGRSDKIILEQMAETLNTPLQNESVELVVSGGDEVKSDGDQITDLLRQLNIPYLFVFDSDGEDKEEKERRISKEIGISPKRVYVLDEYSIESYLTKSERAIAQAINEEETEVRQFLRRKSNIENKSTVLDSLYKEKVGMGYHKEKNGAAIAKHMKEDEIAEDIKSLIDRIVDLA